MPGFTYPPAPASRLMSRPVVCPHCGEELDIPSELRGRDVRCASCRNIFHAAADAPAPPRASRAASGRVQPGRDEPGRSTDDDDRAPWDDSPRRRRKSRMRWLWAMLGCGGVLAFVGCCGCGAFLMKL